MIAQKISIAIADDHTLVRKGFASLIESISDTFVVTLDVDNGRELIDNLLLLDTIPDVIILDVSMPELDGYETTSELRKLYPYAKILALSIFDKEFSIIRMLKNGANGYLHKSCSADELLQAINDVYLYGFHYSKLATEKVFALLKNNKLSAILATKEIQFIRFCCFENLTYEQIAKLLYISVSTAYEYQKKICKKLGLHTRTELAIFALHTGIFPIERGLKWKCNPV